MHNFYYKLCQRVLFILCLKPVKVYFGCDYMDPFNFGLNEPIWVKKKIDKMDQFGSVWGGLIQLNTRLQNNPIPDSGWL